MENHENIHIDDLQDLIQILTERIEAYTAAISSVDPDKDIDLIAFFEKSMQLSQQFKSELLVLLPKEGLSPSKKQWTAGTLYNKWEKQNPCIAASGREQVLKACEKMEQIMQGIFKQMLSSKNNFSENTTTILKSQATLQQEIYELIKDLRAGKSNPT